MSRPRLVIPSALVAAALTLAGCSSETAGSAPESTPSTETSEPARSDDTSPSDAGTDDGAASDATDDADPDAASPDDGDLPVSDTDPDGGAGPDDDAVSYPATGSVLPPECGVEVFHPIDHEIVEWDFTEVAGGIECFSEVDSRGDSLFIADEIAARLDAAGHEQTSRPPGDDGSDAVNVMSYLVGDGELHVTVQQTGPTGIKTFYAYVSPPRGNG